MDTLKILLGATVALLLAALGLSWKNIQGTGKDSKDLTEQQIELQKLKLEHDRLQLEVMKLNQQGAGAINSGTGTLPPVANNSATAPVANTTASNDADKALIKELQDKIQKAQDDAKLKDDEQNYINERNKKYPDPETGKQARRVAMIQQAMLMARVVEWVDSADAGSFATIQILSPENVQPGTELLIRRNGGILGKLVVDRIEPDGAAANPVTKFAGAKPVAGDELILEPPFIGPIDGDDSAAGDHR